MTTFGKTTLAGQRLSGEVLRAFDLWPYKYKGGKRRLSGHTAPGGCLHTCWSERTEEIAT